MNNHPAPAPAPPHPIVVLQTITDIFNQTTSIFSTLNNRRIVVLLSFIFFNLRFGIDLTTQALTSYIDNQPSIQSYYSPIPQSPPKSAPPTTTTLRHNLLLNPQFDNEIRASEFLRSSSNFTFAKTLNDIVSDENNDAVSTNDSTEFMFPLGVFTVSYAILMGGFILLQSCVHGVIFVLVLNQFCGIHNNSLPMVLMKGFRLGFNRSYNMIGMRWHARGIITLFLCCWFFGGVEDKNSIIKISAREVFMPYTIFTPAVEGFEVETQGVIIPWIILDFLVSFLLTLDTWVVMGDPTKTVDEVVREGWHLLWLKFLPGLMLKGIETIVCGPYARWVLATIFGGLYARVFEASMEVCFLVVWMVYYLSVKSIDANFRGQPFGQPQLQAMLEDNA